MSGKGRGKWKDRRCCQESGSFEFKKLELEKFQIVDSGSEMQKMECLQAARGWGKEGCDPQEEVKVFTKANCPSPSPKVPGSSPVRV